MTDKIAIYVGTIAAALIGLAAIVLIWRLRRCKLMVIPIGIAVIGITMASVLFWYTHRALPDNLSGELFSGIAYRREVLDDPIIVYTVRVDLRASGIHFMVTPNEQTNGFVLPARTTSQFLKEFGLQVAINADFFDPWRDYGFWDYYPHEGDGVNLRGLTVSQGDRYTEGYAPPQNYNTLSITEDNQGSFIPPQAPIYNAISGNMMLIVDGIVQPIDPTNDYLTGKHPRTAVALDETSNALILFIIDGRQPNYSEGVTIPELAAIILERGGYNALNLDGGGSVTLAVEGSNRQPQILNSPIHNHIPGRERPVGNHLGIFSLPIGA